MKVAVEGWLYFSVLAVVVCRHIVNYIHRAHTHTHTHTHTQNLVLTLVFTLRSVPASNRSLIHSLFPFLQARNRGVCPPAAA
jgi:hypothetical protein